MNDKGYICGGAAMQILTIEFKYKKGTYSKTHVLDTRLSQ